MLDTLGVSAGLSVISSIFGGNSQKKQAYRQLAYQAESESKQVIAERLGTTIQNAYSVAYSQMQLGLQKRQTAQEWGAVTAASLAAKGDASVGIASTGTMGASAQAVLSDIDKKTNEALAAVYSNYDSAAQAYNYDLDMMRVSTRIGQPVANEYKYTGPSTSNILLGGLLQGAATFASGYASSKFKLS